jgi:hypothetical protein
MLDGLQISFPVLCIAQCDLWSLDKSGIILKEDDYVHAMIRNKNLNSETQKCYKHQYIDNLFFECKFDRE